MLACGHRGGARVQGLQYRSHTMGKHRLLHRWYLYPSFSSVLSRLPDLVAALRLPVRSVRKPDNSLIYSSGFRLVFLAFSVSFNLSSALSA